MRRTAIKKELPHYDRRCRLISPDDAKKRVAAGEICDSHEDS